jgi:hypothetical protein
MESLYCSEIIEICGIRTHFRTNNSFNLHCQSDNSKKDNRKSLKRIKKNQIQNSIAKLWIQLEIFIRKSNNFLEFVTMNSRSFQKYAAFSRGWGNLQFCTNPDNLYGSKISKKARYVIYNCSPNGEILEEFLFNSNNSF